MRTAIILFAIGVFAATADFLVAYVSQLLFAERVATGGYDRATFGFRAFAVGLAIVSFLSFLAGAVTAAFSF